MHQIHSVAHARYVGYQLVGLGDAGEQKECAEGEHYAVDGAERPAYLNGWCGMNHARRGLYIERQNGGCGTYNHGGQTYRNALLRAPVDVYTYVVGQHQIAQVP